MNTNSNTLQVGPVNALVVRKPVKNLHLSVLPPDGKVRVTAPNQMKDDAIRLLLASRISWIRKQTAKFEAQERESKREYVSGESHYFFGKRTRLEVIYEDRTAGVRLKGKDKIILAVRPNSNRAKREQVMAEWYRGELKRAAVPLLEKWSGIIGVQPVRWGIKRMKTRWGTCNHRTGQILLNLELAKKPVESIEYIVVHELLHLIENKHNGRFIRLLDHYLPKWRSIKEDLNRFMLSDERWG